MNQKKLESLPTPELDKLLQAELQKDTPKGMYVRSILRVLEEREKDYPAEITPQIQAAWEKFTKEDQRRAERPKPTARNWVFRAAAALAAVVILVSGLMVIPMEAKADTWWEKFWSWTDGFFSSINFGDKDFRGAEYVFETDNEGLQEVYDAVTELGVTAPVVPMWLPEGYTLDKLEVSNLQAKSVACASFIEGSNSIIFQAEVFERGALRRYQKDETNVIEREINEMTYNLMRNQNRWVAVWTNKNVECSLSADCGEEDFYEILNSI